ncbi:MAG TPA: DinB family protein [Candidatus Acidoferrum sp.]|nr:DinB family protein [Candidatus Acidoferrum sp.]
MGRMLMLAVLMIVACTGPILMQGQASPATTPTQVQTGLMADVRGQWNLAGRRLLEMAQDFPEDKFDYRPTPEVRTFAEQILHATAASAVFTDIAQGIKPASYDDVEKPSREKYKTRAQIVDYIQKTFADGAAVIEKYGDKRLLELVDSPFDGKVTRASMFTFAASHVYEHYGQCVVYYRLNGLVPPVSRKRM